MEQRLERTKIKKYSILFLLLVLLVFFFLTQGTDMKTVWSAMKQADPRLILAGLVLAELFHVAEGRNIGAVLRSFGYRVSFRQEMRYAYLGYFFSSITPSSTGGQPAQLYAMNRDHIQIAHGTLALLVELTSMQMATFVMETAAWIGVMTGRIHLSRQLLILAVAGYLMNVLFIAFLIIVIGSDQMKEKLLYILKKFINILPVKGKEVWSGKFDDIQNDFETCGKFLRQQPKLTVRLFLTSLLQIMCWFSVPCMVYLALGEYGASYGTIFLHQAVLYMTTALLPFPGAEGINEYAFLCLFRDIFRATPMAAVVLVNRGISFYLPLAISALLGVVLKDRKPKKPYLEHRSMTQGLEVER